LSNTGSVSIGASGGALLAGGSSCARAGDDARGAHGIRLRPCELDLPVLARVAGARTPQVDRELAALDGAQKLT
jgi:hypothetical protein